MAEGKLDKSQSKELAVDICISAIAASILLVIVASLLIYQATFGNISSVSEPANLVGTTTASVDVRIGPSSSYAAVLSIPGGTPVKVLAQSLPAASEGIRWLNVSVKSDDKTVYGWIPADAVVAQDDSLPLYVEELMLWIDYPSQKVITFGAGFEIAGWALDGSVTPPGGTASIYSITVFEGNSCSAENKVLARGVPSTPDGTVVEALNGSAGTDFFKVKLKLNESHLFNRYRMRVEEPSQDAQLIAVCAQSRASGHVVAWVLPIERR